MVIGKPLITAEQIQTRVRELADTISRDYAGKDILAVGILRGAFMFFSDLVRSIQVPLSVDFIVASSYIECQTTGDVTIHYDGRDELKDKDILLIEDIVDSGVTISKVKERFLSRQPRSLRICALLDKKERREVAIDIDYVGFNIPDEFVVGYGLDYENRFRNLPYIAAFRKTL